ncbi:MAG: phosphatase [Parcubacteria group bacterium]|nr:MAG: phosphatase [Parcubacteria group bacterium]
MEKPATGKLVKTPKYFILDVDGVLTDGSYYYTVDGKIAKLFGPDDNDALGLLKKYLIVHLISGDKRGFAITKKRVVEDMKLPLDLVSTFERVEWIKKNYDLSQTIYMGDGIFDAMVFAKVAYAIAPANAIHTAKQHAHFVTPSRGGDSAVAEACIHIMEKFFEPFDPLNPDLANHQSIWKESR